MSKHPISDYLLEKNDKAEQLKKGVDTHQQLMDKYKENMRRILPKTTIYDFMHDDEPHATELEYDGRGRS